MTPPNVVNVVGGLGNQLFQFLFGIALEQETGRQTVYDVSDFERYRLHEGLVIETYFSVLLDRAQPADLANASWLVRGFHRKRVVSKLAPYLGPLSPVLTDETWSLTNRHDRGPRYFRGYWQAQPYAPSTLEEVRRRLRFQPALMESAEKKLLTLRVDCDSCAAIQVRRGDFLHTPKNSPHYGLPLGYFYSAMEKMNARRGIRTFYVFSDDLEGLKAEFRPDFEVVYVDKTVSTSAGMDLCLMSAFPNLIMSNSSFGWWAAALRADPSGTVYAPAQWLNPGYPNQALSPTLLPGWEALEVPTA